MRLLNIFKFLGLSYCFLSWIICICYTWSMTSLIVLPEPSRRFTESSDKKSESFFWTPKLSMAVVLWVACKKKKKLTRPVSENFQDCGTKTCFLTSFWVMTAPESWSKHIFSRFQPFLLFWKFFGDFSSENKKNVWKAVF